MDEEYQENATNRIEGLVDDIIALSEPDDMMLAIVDTLKEVEVIPDVGKYYTFIYLPKTPRIRYDEFPLIKIPCCLIAG